MSMGEFMHLKQATRKPLRTGRETGSLSTIRAEKGLVHGAL
ncbi:hypothetical protein ABFT80_01990 [Mesorhizobium sp. SB112]